MLSFEALVELDKMGADLTLKMDADLLLKVSGGRNILFFLNPFDVKFFSIIEFLVKVKGLDINTQDDNGFTCFMVKKPVTFEGIRRLEMLGANFLLFTKDQENILFYIEPSSDDYEKIIGFLVQKGLDLNRKKLQTYEDSESGLGAPRDEVFFFPEKGDDIKENYPWFFVHLPDNVRQLRFLEGLGLDIHVEDAGSENILWKYLSKYLLCVDAGKMKEYEEIIAYLIKEGGFDVNRPNARGEVYLLKYPPSDLAHFRKYEDLGMVLSLHDSKGENLLFKFFCQMQSRGSIEILRVPGPQNEYFEIIIGHLSKKLA